MRDRIARVYMKVKRLVLLNLSQISVQINDLVNDDKLLHVKKISEYYKIQYKTHVLQLSFTAVTFVDNRNKIKQNV